MKNTVLAAIIGLGSLGTLSAQDTTPKAWTYKLALGADAAALFQYQPRQGAGQDRLGLGGSILLEAKRKKGRTEWINTGSWLFGMQKLGDIANQDNPFQKQTDLLILRSNFDYSIAEGSKFGYWAGTEFQSQVLPTYTGNLLSDPNNLGVLTKFLAPANLIFAPGMTYKPNDHLKFRFSPASVKLNMVLDDRLASLGKLGNPWRSATDYDKVAFQLGAFANVNYTNKFLKDRIVIASNLNLYFDYLRNQKLESIDVDWNTQIDLVIFKGLSVGLNTLVWYDNDYDVVTNKTTGQLGKGVSVTNQLLVKYSVIF